MVRHSMEGTGIFEHPVNLKRMRQRTICVECGKQYEINSEKDRKVKDKYYIESFVQMEGL